MRDAQSLLDKVISFGTSEEVTDQEVSEILGLIDRRILHSTLEGMVRGKPAKVLEAIDTVYGYGFELSQFSEELLEVVRNATFLRLSPESRRYVDIADDEVESLAHVVEGVDPEQLHRLFASLVDVHDQVSRASRPRLILEMAAVRLATPRPAQPIGTLVKRLEDLERRTRDPKGRGTRRAPR